MKRLQTLIRQIVPLAIFVLFSLSTAADERPPGPHIIPIDYESLYAMPEPPAYQPFDVYGTFLLSVAAQQTPLVMNPAAQVPDNVVQTSDVAFKSVDGVDLSLDVYAPKGDATPNPLVLIIHGGYWKTGDKSIHVQQGIEFAELGYTAASVNYRLSADYKFPSNVEDIYDAILFLTENAGRFNIDPLRIATYGGSAGGHLSAFVGLAANTSGRAYNEGINADAIKGVITLYGMHDLTLNIQREHPFTVQYIGVPFTADASAYRDASPVYHVDSDDPPVLIVHGAIDGSVSVLNSDALSSSLENSGVPYTYDRVEGWPHGMDFFSPIGERTLWHIYHFLKANMPTEEMLQR